MRDDARITAAYALVSLRGGALQMPARGRLRATDKVRSEVVLAAGGAIEGAPDLVLDVHEVVLPAALLGIEGDGLPRQLLAGTSALDVRPVVRLRPGWHPDAAALLWRLDDAWRVRVGSGPPRPLHGGDSVDIDGGTLHAVEVPLGAAGRLRTRGDFAAPVVLDACVDSVTVGGLPPVVVGGVSVLLAADDRPWRVTPDPTVPRRRPGPVHAVAGHPRWRAQASDTDITVSGDDVATWRHPTRATGMVWLAWGLLVTGGLDGVVRVGRPDGTEVATLPAHDDRVGALAVSPDGVTRASVGWDGVVRILPTAPLDGRGP